MENGAHTSALIFGFGKIGENCVKYITYHQVKQGVDCPDGIMAAAIAQLANPDAD
jgi:hypothetical protein